MCSVAGLVRETCAGRERWAGLGQQRSQNYQYRSGRIFVVTRDGDRRAALPAKGGKAADLPADIPADGSGEDQVARQIREAAMAEKDPKVREAWWEEYRRHTGIKK